MKTITIKPGSIILWKKYSRVREWFYKLINKDLPYNDCRLMVNRVEHVTVECDKYLIIEPRKQYSKLEQVLLRDASELVSTITIGIDKLIPINVVRPNTVNFNILTLDNMKDNKYYRVVYDTSTND